MRTLADSKNSGFTLLEVCIVLLIIGLLTGGIVIGQTMVRQTQIMSIIVDEQKYVKAATSFRDKYNALPGDMVNATSYWGPNSTGCPLPTNYTQPGAATCNGDGNGVINSDGTGEGAANSWETFYAWQQLADAGFIPGAYTGTMAPNQWTEATPGLNVPSSKVTGAGFEWYAVNANGAVGDLSTWFYAPIYYQQYLLFGGDNGSYDLFQPMINSSEAQSIDAKIDDGLPGTGLVTASNAQFAYQSPCSSTNSATTAIYNTGALYCDLLFQVNW